MAKYPIGSEIESEVIAVKPYGYFVQFTDDVVGYISAEVVRKLPPGTKYEIGSKLKVQIESYSEEHGKFNVHPLS